MRNPALLNMHKKMNAKIGIRDALILVFPKIPDTLFDTGITSLREVFSQSIHAGGGFLTNQEAGWQVIT